MDHSGQPLAGVMVSIGHSDLSTTTDSEGRFQFEGAVPPGRIDLFIDGRAVVATPGLAYPALHFETTVIAGQDNQLPRPVYLPPVHLDRRQTVGGDQDVHFTLPGFEGFEMIVKAHSVTFPDGSQSGEISVNPVHNDRLPMVPPGGGSRFGSLAWTIQPSGTRFDPPIQIKLPNPGGMGPGETVTLVQWDHDLATFVPIGRATVSEDGAQLVSDPGSGISKAGWGGGVPPVIPNDAHHDQCSASANGRTINGDCECILLATANDKEQELFLAVPPGLVPSGLFDNDPITDVTFSARSYGSCEGLQIRWEFGDGEEGSGADLSHGYAAAGDYGVRVTPTCPHCHQSPLLIRVVPFKATISTPVIPVFEIDASPAMPDAEFQVTVTPSTATADLTYVWFLETRFKKTHKTVTVRDEHYFIPFTLFPEPSLGDTVTGVDHWTPDWGGQFIAADEVSAEVKVFHVANRDSFYRSKKDGYKIIGKNPPKATIQGVLGTDPWFINGIVQQESDWRQFGADGMPLFGEPRGFGLMQYDNPPATREQLFDWRANARAARDKIYEKLDGSATVGEGAQAFWDRQIEQYEMFLRPPRNPRVPVHGNVTRGACTFSHTGGGGNRSFRDGVWIKRYNGASRPNPTPVVIHSGNWMYWDNTDLGINAVPYWQLVELNNGNRNYVQAICNNLN